MNLPRFLLFALPAPFLLAAVTVLPLTTPPASPPPAVPSTPSALSSSVADGVELFAQFTRGGRGGRGGGRGGARGGLSFNFPNAAGVTGINSGPPLDPELDWPMNPAFKSDVFVFTRLIYDSGFGGRGRSGGSGWSTDTPVTNSDGRDADASIAFRLNQMTSLKVRPGHTYAEITPQNLAKHPFVYMVEPGRLLLRDDEVRALRNYLLTGGFLMVDDFWGDDEWENFYEQVNRIFPELPDYLPAQSPGANLDGGISIRELPIEHPIFHTVFDLKTKPQVPNLNNYLGSGQSYDRARRGNDTAQVHYKAVFDRKGRMMMIICHNTDFGDGWEREGENVDYFKRFSEPQAYPMMINILFYIMSH
jgi:hypothetical protein